MAAAGALFALLFLATILGTIGLWYAIDRETADSPTMSRADAERAARQDTADESRGKDRRTMDDRETDNSAADTDWGTDSEWGVDDADDRR